MALSDYVESLYESTDFSTAFQTFHNEAQSLGFEAVLYTHIPMAVLDQSLQPVYQVSDNFNQKYLEHYASARFDRFDPLIKAVRLGEKQPLNWWGALCKHYINDRKESLEVLTTSQACGIKNGITLPLMPNQRGISGASFISTETKHSFNKLLDEQLDNLTLRARLFHSMVVASAHLSNEFVKPLIDSLSSTEKQFLMGLAAGKSPAQIAAELNRTEKYLEQVMLKIRRKLSGVSPNDRPSINRNQVLYYAGLLAILEHPSKP